MVTEMSIARSPTSSDTRPPYSTRVRVSRPRSSVPNGWAGDGPSKRRRRFVVAGSYGEGPARRTATTMRASVMTSAMARRWRRKRRHDSDSAGLSLIGTARSLSLVLDPRVEQTVGDVRQEVPEHDKDRREHDDGHEHRVVTPHRRLVEEAP